MTITTSAFSAPKSPAPSTPSSDPNRVQPDNIGTAFPTNDLGLTTTLTAEPSAVIGSPASPEVIGTQKPFSTPVGDVLK